MRLPSHLRLSRHGVWCFRLVLPDVLAVALGQKEMRRSLGTRCPLAAKLLSYRLSGKILPIIRETKRAMDFDPNSIDPTKVRELIVKGLEIDKRTGKIKADYIETNPDPIIAEREMAWISSMADTKEGSPMELADIALRAQLEANIPIPQPKPGEPCTLEQGIVAFLNFKGDLSKGSLTTYEYRLNLFARLVGGPTKMLHDISKAACQKAAEDFRSMSPHSSKRSPAKSGKGIVSAGTVKDTLTLWQGFFEWAIDSNRYIGENPIKKIPRPSASNNKRGAEAFRPDELQKIFRPENFSAMKRPHQYWAPLIGLFTGARSNEVAQLRLSDFITIEGVRCINIEHDPDDEIPTQLKNTASNRVLPLHPTLWAIGLQDYLDDLNELGADRLLPNLPADGNGKREKYLSRDFNEGLLQELKIWRKRKKVFNSFRDTATSKLAAAKVHSAHIHDWTGHARQGTEGLHYIAPLTVPQQVENILPVLEFGVDFSEFKYQRGRWNEWLRNNLVP